MPETDVQRSVALAVSDAILRKPLPLPLSSSSSSLPPPPQQQQQQQQHGDNNNNNNNNSNNGGADDNDEGGAAPSAPSPPNTEEQAAAAPPPVLLAPSALTRAVEEEVRRQLGLAGHRLAAFKIPKEVVAVSRLPTTATGKVQKHRLVEMLRQRTDTGDEPPPRARL